MNPNLITLLTAGIEGGQVTVYVQKSGILAINAVTDQESGVRSYVTLTTGAVWRCFDTVDEIIARMTRLEDVHEVEITGEDAAKLGELLNEDLKRVLEPDPVDWLELSKPVKDKRGVETWFVLTKGGNVTLYAQVETSAALFGVLTNAMNLSAFEVQNIRDLSWMRRTVSRPLRNELDEIERLGVDAYRASKGYEP